MRPRPDGRGLLLAARSVHGVGIDVTLLVVSLDGAGRVRRVALLRPGGFFLDPGARWIVELAASCPAPARGVVLTAARCRRGRAAPT